MFETAQCSRCQIGLAEAGYSTALCRECRSALMHRPVPRWLPWAGVAVVALLVAGLIHLPQAIDGERALDNALIAEKQGDYPGAVKQLHILLERYPDSDRWTAQLGIDQYLAGDTVAAVHTFDHLSLNRLDNTTRTKVDRVRTDIQKHAGLTDRV